MPSDISNYLNQIRTAVYGREVREAIADGIEQCYNDTSNGVTLAETKLDELDGAVERLNGAVDNAEANMNEAVSNALESLDDAVESANGAVTTANAAATRAQELNTALGNNANDLVLVQNEQPNKEFNKIWVDPDVEEHEVPTYQEFSDLKSALSNLNDLDYSTEREYVDDLAYGRIATNGTIGAEQYIAYSPVMRAAGDTWYFDTANFRLYIAYYNEETDTVPASFSSWITESPYTVPGGRPYYKLMVSRLTSSGQLDINAAQGSVYMLNELPSALIDAAKLADARLATVYVSATNGNDSNAGTASSPLATIQAAIDSGASEILVEEGVYPRFVIDGAKYPISIRLWNFNGTTHKIKITDSGVGTNTMIRINNCLDITISDMWADNAQRALFYITKVQRATLIRCIASNNTTASFSGFAFEDTNAFLYDCIAHDIAQDGYNFHKTGSSLMENCTAYNCTDDGVSHHDQCTGSIIGGEFYNCGKGGVASPTYGAYIDIHNVYSHDNEYGLFAEGQSNKLINCRVSGCAFKNNTLYDLYANYGTVVGWNNIYDTLRNLNNAYTEIVKSN